MKHPTFLSLFFILLCVASACKTASTGTNRASSNTDSKKEESAPAIEMTPEALGKEWMANPAETENKYKGKTLAVSGEVYLAQQIDDQVFIDIMGVMFDAKTRGAKITCISPPSFNTRLLLETVKANERMMKETSRKDMQEPKMEVAFKGIYSRSAPPEILSANFIELKPCELTSVRVKANN